MNQSYLSQYSHNFPAYILYAQHISTMYAAVYAPHTLVHTFRIMYTGRIKCGRTVMDTVYTHVLAVWLERTAIYRFVSVWYGMDWVLVCAHISASKRTYIYIYIYIHNMYIYIHVCNMSAPYGTHTVLARKPSLVTYNHSLKATDSFKDPVMDD